MDTEEKLADRFYLNDKTADVYFVFEQKNVKVFAHKVLLAAKSDVFMAMFFGELKEKGDIKILEEDLLVDAFTEFLRYFYFKKVKLSTKNADSILYLGRKYEVVKCVDDYVKFFTQTLNNERACGILDRALFYDLDQMIKVCSNYISVNTSAVFSSTQFLGCSFWTLKSKCLKQLWHGYELIAKRIICPRQM